MTGDGHTSRSSRSAEWLSTLGAIGITAIAAARCVVVFAPQVVFDVDPAAMGALPLGGLGPGGSLLLDALLLLACGAGLIGEAMAGRRINWLLMLAAILPGFIAAWHGTHSLGDLWRGMTWTSAAVACATAWHLARDPRKRTKMLAVLLAVIVPVMIRGAAQLTSEHAETMEAYRAQRDVFLRSRGWEPDSAAARMYERRLEQPQPLGWFTTSNIFASLMIVGFTCGAGLAAAARKARMESGWWGVMVMFAVAAAAGIAFSGSKGAVMAACAGLGLLMARIIMQRRGIAVRWGGVLAILCVTGVIGAVVVRGALLPEGFAGDKSLLFRWHYAQASKGIISENTWFGVGPDRFQEWYTRFRPLRNPEEVSSAHNVFLDWVCGLGAGGWVWTAMTLWLVWRCGTMLRAGVASTPTGSVTPSSPRLKWIAIVACAAAMASMFAVEGAVLDERGAMMRSLCVLAFAGMAAILWRLTNVLDGAPGVFASAVIALVVHGQVEMTYTQPGSAAWAMIVLGVCASRGPSLALPDSSRSRSFSGMTMGVLLLCGGSALAWCGARPALRLEADMMSAAQPLDALSKQANVPTDAAKKTRSQSADALIAAYDRWPMDAHVLDAAARQLDAAAAATIVDAESMPFARHGLQIAERAVREHGSSSSIAMTAELAARLALATHDSADWEVAIGHARRMTEIDPNGLGAWRRLGDVLWSAGRRREAVGAYQRALECDANFELDELKRLTERERRLIEKRMKEAGNEQWSDRVHGAG